MEQESSEALSKSGSNSRKKMCPAKTHVTSTRSIQRSTYVVYGHFNMCVSVAPVRLALDSSRMQRQREEQKRLQQKEQSPLFSGSSVTTVLTVEQQREQDEKQAL